MLNWTFLQGIPPDNQASDLARFQAQAASDMYKAMQARLDGYRQSAGAIFIGVVAAALTFDSAFFRLIIDPSLVDKFSDSQPAQRFALTAVGGAGAVIVVVCIASLFILRGIGRYFAEMTSIIHKIDEANRVWDKDIWLQHEPLFPLNFRVEVQDPSRHNVARSPKDRELIGWHDPAIRGFFRVTVVIAIVHFLFYGSLAFLLLCG